MTSSSYSSHNSARAERGHMSDSENTDPWIATTMLGSLYGRTAMASLDTISATTRNTEFLSPWGDSNPLILPCIRLRDIPILSFSLATGGMSTVVEPALDPLLDDVISSFVGEDLVTLAVEKTLEHTSFVAQMLVEQMVLEDPVNYICDQMRSSELETTQTEVLQMVLKHRITQKDADLAYYRSTSVYRSTSLVSTARDYLAIEKGWFSPYLYASNRRPLIPRKQQADVIFCRGPFLEGDQKIGQALLQQSKWINMCRPLASQHVMQQAHTHDAPQRLAIMLVGIKPHRELWSSSKRPDESKIHYILMNGCPAIIIPARRDAPLISWSTLTLTQLWKIDLPTSNRAVNTSEFGDVIKVLWEFLDRFVMDWQDVSISPNLVTGDIASEESKKKALTGALRYLVVSAIRTKGYERIRKEIDPDRAGIAAWRIF